MQIGLLNDSSIVPFVVREALLTSSGTGPTFFFVRGLAHDGLTTGLILMVALRYLPA
jgi:hypothetical protein